MDDKLLSYDTDDKIDELIKSDKVVNGVMADIVERDIKNSLENMKNESESESKKQG